MTIRTPVDRQGSWRVIVGWSVVLALASCIQSPPDPPRSPVPGRAPTAPDPLPVVEAVAVVTPDTIIAPPLPLDRAAAARRGAARAARGSVRAGMKTAEAIDSPPTQAPFDTFAFLAIAAGIVVAPVAAIVGAAGRAAMGAGPEAIAEAEASLARALADYRPDDGVAAAVIEAAAKLTGQAPADCGDTRKPEACVLPDGSRPGVLLRLDWGAPFFEIEGEIGRQFRLVQRLEGTILEAGNDSPAWRRIWIHRGPPEDFVDLAAADARLFRSLLADARSALVEQAIADLFPPGPAEPQPTPQPEGRVWTVLPPTPRN